MTIEISRPKLYVAGLVRLYLAANGMLLRETHLGSNYGSGEGYSGS